MTTYKMKIAYDGTGYGGWQVQPNAVSIQSVIEKALFISLREKISVTGSGRTDAGVHALGQIAHFQTGATATPYRLKHSLNGLLPKAIRIVDLEEISDHFHARYSATGKIYHYHLHLDRVASPFNHLYSLHVHHTVDLSLLEKAAICFLGTKDFSAFTHEAHLGSAAKNPVRTLQRIDLVEEVGGVRLEFEGDGFLYKMVRNITGTLLDICAGHIQIEEIESIFSSKDRKKAGKTAPPEGLFLIKVHYKEELFKISSNESI